MCVCGVRALKSLSCPLSLFTFLSPSLAPSLSLSCFLLLSYSPSLPPSSFPLSYPTSHPSLLPFLHPSLPPLSLYLTLLLIPPSYPLTLLSCSPAHALHSGLTYPRGFNKSPPSQRTSPLWTEERMYELQKLRTTTRLGSSSWTFLTSTYARTYKCIYTTVHTWMHVQLQQ